LAGLIELYTFSQVGHKAAVLVASFSPRMYKVDGQLASCLALGSQVRLYVQSRCAVLLHAAPPPHAAP